MTSVTIAGDCRGAQLREATGAEAGAIASVLLRSFADYEHLYTPAGYAATILDAPKVRQRMQEGPSWVATGRDGIVGTVSAVPRQGGSLYIRGMAVLPWARGQRIGTLMLEMVQSFAVSGGHGTLLLSTTPFLAGAIRLYEQFGFERCADGPHELHGTPLFSMKKRLDTL